MSEPRVGDVAAAAGPGCAAIAMATAMPVTRANDRSLDDTRTPPSRDTRMPLSPSLPPGTGLGKGRADRPSAEWAAPRYRRAVSLGRRARRRILIATAAVAVSVVAAAASVEATDVDQGTGRPPHAAVSG